VLDREKHRVTGLNFPVSFPDTASLEPPLPQLGKLATPECEVVEHRRARYTDLDINRHLNNAKYAAWISDLFAVGEYESAAITQLQINFIAEIPPETDVALALKRDGDVFYASGDHDGKHLFESCGKWSDTP
jgi:hypothetical protein